MPALTTKRCIGFSSIASMQAVALAHHAERHLHLVVAHRHRRVGAGLDVALDHAAEVLLGQQVGVGDDEVAAPALSGSRLSAPAVPRRCALAQVADLDAEAAAVAEVGLDLLGLVVDGQVEAPEALLGEDLRTMVSSSGREPTCSIGLGVSRVSSFSRVPRPPAMITTQLSRGGAAR